MFCRVFAPVFIASLYLNIAEIIAAPLADTGPWTHPCTHTAPLTSRLLLLAPPPSDDVTAIKNRLTSVILKYRDGLELATHVKEVVIDPFFIEEIRNDILQSTVLTNTLEALPLLSGFPISEISTLKLEDNIKNEYEKMASVYIFLEQTLIDGNYYATDAEKILIKIKQILCEFHSMLNTLSVQFTSQVTRNIMLPEHRLLPESKQVNRDYIIARDTIKIFTESIPIFDWHLKQ